MRSAFITKPQVWFWIVAGLLVLWGVTGCYACFEQFRVGAASWNDPANVAYDRAFYAKLPAWFNYVYALAVGTGLAGAIALLRRSRSARWLFTLSLIAVVIQFGYVFLATDMIAHKGVGKVMPVPIVIVAVAAFSIWFAGLARRRGWLR